MREYAAEMASAIGPCPLIVEYGSGSSVKTRVLTRPPADADAYIPIDISGKHLMNSVAALQRRYPDLSILPVCADYTRPIALPDIDEADSARTVAYFPGSTIGNMDPAAALAFLRSVRATCGRDSRLLIGVDLKKDPSTIHAAYNDSAGVTAAFNLNILRRLNHEIGSDFELDSFCHYAFYNPCRAAWRCTWSAERSSKCSFPRAAAFTSMRGKRSTPKAAINTRFRSSPTSPRLPVTVARGYGRTNGIGSACNFSREPGDPVSSIVESEEWQRVTARLLSVNVGLPREIALARTNCPNVRLEGSGGG